MSCAPNCRICHRGLKRSRALWVEAKDHVKFRCEVYSEQARSHRWFVHEHLVEATSWNPEVVRQILEKDGVHALVADQCMYGLLTWSKNGRVVSARRGTKLMTSCPEISAELQIQCDGSFVEHQRLLGGGAKHTQILCWPCQSDSDPSDGVEAACESGSSQFSSL